MGKIDDMRRQREQQFADAEHRQAKAAKARPVDVVAPPVPPVRASAPVSADTEIAQPTRPSRPTADKKKTSSKSGGAVDEQGKCPGCGKMKPLSNGVLANHQKGFGKACTGSRKKPV
jgi:hypothetical protein